MGSFPFSLASWALRCTTNRMEPRKSLSAPGKVLVQVYLSFRSNSQNKNVTEGLCIGPRLIERRLRFENQLLGKRLVHQLIATYSFIESYAGLSSSSPPPPSSILVKLQCSGMTRSLKKWQLVQFCANDCKP